MATCDWSTPDVGVVLGARGHKSFIRPRTDKVVFDHPFIAHWLSDVLDGCAGASLLNGRG